MMQLYASEARLRSSGSPFFCPAWKPCFSASDRHLGSLMANRRLQAPVRQNLMPCCLLLFELVLLFFTPPDAARSLQALHLC